MTVVIREDLLEAQRSAWDALAALGSWWTGAQRFELAETRHGTR